MLLRISLVQHLILLMAMGVVGGYVCYRTCIDVHLNTIQRLHARLQVVAQQKIQKQAEKKFSSKSAAAVMSIIQNEITQQHAQLLSIQRFLPHAIECKIWTTYAGALHILDLMRGAECDYVSMKRDAATDVMELRFKCES